MAQFDIYPHPDNHLEGPIKYLLDLQAAVFDELSTRVVAPLVPQSSLSSHLRTLNPRVIVQGEPCILLLHLLAAIPAKVLGRPVDSAKSQRDELIRSVDFLFTGN
jgi:toxin CcdB